MPKLNMLTNHKKSTTPVYNDTRAQTMQGLHTHLNQPVRLKTIKTYLPL